MALSAIGLATVASADSLDTDNVVIDTSNAWSPGPVTGVQAPVRDWDEETENEFVWAGDRDFGLLMSFDPDDEEVFLGWQIDF